MWSQRRRQWPSIQPTSVLDMDSRAFQMLHFKIELTVVIPSNTKRRRNVVLMFDQRRKIDTALNQQRSQNLEV